MVRSRQLRGGMKRISKKAGAGKGKGMKGTSKAVHEAIFQPGSLTLVVSPGGRQSKEFVAKAEEFARIPAPFLKAGDRPAAALMSETFVPGGPECPRFVSGEGPTPPGKGA